MREEQEVSFPTNFKSHLGCKRWPSCRRPGSCMCSCSSALTEHGSGCWPGRAAGTSARSWCWSWSCARASPATQRRPWGDPRTGRSAAAARRQQLSAGACSPFCTELEERRVERRTLTDEDTKGHDFARMIGQLWPVLCICVYVCIWLSNIWFGSLLLSEWGLLPRNDSSESPLPLPTSADKLKCL